MTQRPSPVPAEPLEERIEAQVTHQREQMRRQARKSFLLTPDQLEEDSPLRAFLLEDKKAQIVEDRLRTKPLLSWWRLKYLVSRNADFTAHSLLEINSLLFAQPFWTIHTRIQAKNKAADHAFYFRNRVDALSTFPGILHTFSLTLLHLGVLVNVQRLLAASDRFEGLSLHRLNYFAYLLTDLVSAPFRNVLEIRRALINMGHKKIHSQEVALKMRQSMGVMIARDFAFRTAVFSVVSTSAAQHPTGLKPQEVGLSLFLGALLSNPLDVICTKMYTQQVEVYPTFRQAIKTIIAEEQSAKFMSGFSMRFAAISMTTAMHFFFFHAAKKRVETSLGIDALID